MHLKKLSQKQREIFDFCKTDETTLICDGSVRSGKTTIMTLAFLAWAMQNYDRTNFAICGKTVQSAERNILRPLMEVEGLGAALALSYKVSTRVLTVRCGARVNWFYLFGGKDESSYMLIQGITLAGVLFDEVALMPQSFVEQATARAISFENPKYFLNCNPESPANWVYKKYIEQPPAGTRHIHFLLEDNPILTPQMIERTKAMYSGVFSTGIFSASGESPRVWFTRCLIGPETSRVSGAGRDGTGSHRTTAHRTLQYLHCGGNMAARPLWRKNITTAGARADGRKLMKNIIRI